MCRRTRTVLAVAFLVLCVPAVRGQEDAKEKAPKGGAWGIFVDPDKDCVFRPEKGKLTISLPGKDHALGAERGKMNAPRALREVEGDFVLQVKVEASFRPVGTTAPKRFPFQGAGLLVMKDDKTYVRVELATMVKPDGSYDFVNFEVRDQGKVTRFGQPADCPVEKDTPLFLRVERHGDRIEAAFSRDGSQWRYLEPKTVALPRQLRVGIAAVNTSTTPFAPQFSAYKLFREVE